jgi:hypothetical protein
MATEIKGIVETVDAMVAKARAEGRAEALAEVNAQLSAGLPTPTAAVAAPTPKVKGKVKKGSGKATAFIKSLPLDTPPSKVVAAGVKKGLTFSAALVSNVHKRMAAEAEAETPKRGRGRPPGSKNKKPAAEKPAKK